MKAIAVCILLLVGAALPAQEPPRPKKLDFNRDIRPLLSENCFACHGFDKGKRKAGLRLDTREGALAKLESGETAIVPGQPAKSALWTRINHADAEERMPPAKTSKKLTPAQIETLRRWIEEGAEYKVHWAYLPPERPPVPAVKNRAWARNDVDRFLLARLEKEGLAPSPEADRATLLRRLSLDLTGLPPSAEEVDAAGDFEKSVDRLLASPHYGERMAIYWLDLVRFADTIGYHSDNPRNIFPYRDWVIAAFNENLSFDRFAIEQLAGDLLPDATVRQKVASGYNRLILSTEEGGAQPKEYGAKNFADRVRNVGSVWLGSTLACAECHDHKFDPFRARDFYSLGAFFADVREADIGKREEGMAVPTPAQEAELARFDARAAALRKSLEISTPELVAAQAGWEAAERGKHLVEWATLTPLKAVSKGGTDVRIAEDHSVVIPSTLPGGAKDLYTLTVRAPAGRITGLLLEALPDKALPKNGPGRLADGKFAPGTIELRSGDTVVALGKPETSYKGAVPVGVESRLLYALELPEGAAELTLVFSDSTLGRFRLSVTDAPPPVKLEKDKGLPKEIAGILRTESEKRTPEQKARIAAYYRTFAPLLDPARKEIAEVEKAKVDFLKPIPKTLVSISDKPRVSRILPRGNWMDDTGEIVQPAVPGFLDPIETADRRATRLDLARWMVSRRNPLTARVFVNRLWKLFFGTGLSKSLEDLGSQGEWPVHPELLDWLAVEFMETGWDVKRMVRLIVTSSAYRQSSRSRKELATRDPHNRLLARQSRWRLDAELVRDNALAASGLLVRTVGGPSVKPHQPAGYWAHLNFPKREWKNDTGEALHRRGLYTWWQRTFIHPSLMAFDAPNREDCCAERPRSNTPQQALALLNDPTYVEAARALAEGMVREPDAGRIDWAFRRALSRKPSAEEEKALRSLRERELERRKADPKAAELESWTAVARAVLNLHETVTRP